MELMFDPKATAVWSKRLDPSASSVALSLTIAGQWEQLRYHEAPDFERALAEFDVFVELLESGGAEVIVAPDAADTKTDSNPFGGQCTHTLTRDGRAAAALQLLQLRLLPLLQLRALLLKPALQLLLVLLRPGRSGHKHCDG